jgi:DUF1016 N-terminal domain
MASKSVMPAGYAALLTRVKERVRTAQIKAALSANRELRDSSPSILSLPVTESAGAIGLLASLPWGHNIVLMQKVKQLDTRLWYARAALEHGWSRSTLLIHIESRITDLIALAKEPCNNVNVSTITEIQEAIDKLPAKERSALAAWLRSQDQPRMSEREEAALLASLDKAATELDAGRGVPVERVREMVGQWLTK